MNLAEGGIFISLQVSTLQFSCGNVNLKFLSFSRTSKDDKPLQHSRTFATTNVTMIDNRHLKMMTRVGLVEHQCGNTMPGLARIPETLENMNLKNYCISHTWLY